MAGENGTDWTKHKRSFHQNNGGRKAGIASSILTGDKNVHRKSRKRTE